MENEKIIEMLSALAQQTRLSVFKMLIKNGKSGIAAGKMAEQLNMPQNSLSSHLKIMSHAGLIKANREGRHLIYSVELDATKNLIGFLINDCCDGHPEICALREKAEL